MKALTWHGKRDVRVDTVPDPAYDIFQRKEDGAAKVVLNP